MNWEERKREKKLPPPAADSQIPRPHSMHEAAPYYTEDIGQDIRAGTVRRPEERFPVPLAKPHPKEHAELKEKCLILESELQNTRLKLALIENENEKLQEDLSCAISDKKKSVYELEISRLTHEAEGKGKLIESLEKSLKLERAKYTQELQDIKKQVNTIKDLYVPGLPVGIEGDKTPAKFFEAKEEAKQLKLQVSILEKEKAELINKHTLELQEQYEYYEAILRDKEMIIESLRAEEKEEIRSSSGDYYRTQGLEHRDWAAPSRPEPPQELIYSSDLHENSLNRLVFNEKSEENPESVAEVVDEIEDLSRNSQGVHENDEQLLENVKTSEFNSWFDSAPDNRLQSSEIFTQDDDAKIANLFSTEIEESRDKVDSPPEWFAQPNKEPEVVNHSDESPQDWFAKQSEKTEFLFAESRENAEDFFNSRTDYNPNKFQTVPSNLFDFS